MRETLRPILACALTVAISAAVHGQLAGTKFEKYTRFLTALILLSLLITPMLELFRAGGALITEEDMETAQTEQTGSSIPELSYTEALISVLQRRVEDDARSALREQYGLPVDDILEVRAQIDGSNPEAIRVTALLVRIQSEADPAEIEKTLAQRYGCENVSVIADA